MIGQTISHYRIVAKLGGGMGVVYIERGVYLDSANNLLRIPFSGAVRRADSADFTSIRITVTGA